MPAPHPPKLVSNSTLLIVSGASAAAAEPAILAVTPRIRLRRQQRDDGADRRHAPKPGIEDNERAGGSHGGIDAEPVNPEGSAAENHDHRRELY